MEKLPDLSTSHVMTPKRRAIMDAIAMSVYLFIVYVWSLGIYPLGSDYQAMAQAHESGPFLAGRLLTTEMALFGSSPIGYHLVNLLLLYACMLCLYCFVRLTVKGYCWLGTLAAALFMSNPVHSEAVLQLSGIYDLIPAFFALLALAAYADYCTHAHYWNYLLALVAFTLAVLPYASNAFLILVFILLNVFLFNQAPKRYAMALIPFVVMAVIGWELHKEIFQWRNVIPADMFTPLYFIFYPLGFLPETANRFHQWPILGWFSVLVLCLLLVLIYHKARRPVLLFSILAMLAIRLFQGSDHVEPVHLVGGGSLLVANALFNVGLVALFFRIMDHIRWRQPVVMLTTLLAAIFFGMEIHSIFCWHEASRIVHAFQTQVQASPVPTGILPDFQYYRGAPMCLSASVAFDTPFSRKFSTVSLLPIHYDPALTVQATSRTSDTITVNLKGTALLNIVPYPYTLAYPGRREDISDARITVTGIHNDSLELKIEPVQTPLPVLLLPMEKRDASFTPAP